MSQGEDASAGTPDPPESATGAALLDLVVVMDRLRSDCPWDARQTHESLVPYLLEETYETLEAIERHDLAELRGELGDVLLQVLFHARIAAERTDGTGFTIDDVAKGIADKLVRRHPHVFADVNVSDADEVKRNWETIKAEERAAAGGGPSSALDGVPMAQPALSLAAQLQRRAQSAGAPDELADLNTDRMEVSEIGAELFALVTKARQAGIDPELELRRAAGAFRDRFKSWEQSSSRS
ncbi:MAG: nucleoside triphosphate pyrophosphohydrolase [Streptosporangiaceae bacterium]